MALKGVYRFIAQERVHFGKLAGDAVLEEAVLRDAKRVLIVASTTLAEKTDVVTNIERKLDSRYADTWTGTREHVPRSSVLELVSYIREVQPDLIVTVGGGTPIDTVKVALVGLAENIGTADELDAYYIRVKQGGALEVPPVGAPPVRQIIVPTTLSGAEFSNLGAAVDPKTEIKHLYTGHEVCGDAVILDPTACLHTPEWLWLSTGMRAVDHAVESICSKAPQPFTDATCSRALGMLASSMRQTKADPSDTDARLQSQLGVWLATTGLGRIPWGASHGIGHQLGAVANVPHGHCSCVMLPSVLRYNFETNSTQQDEVARAMGHAAGPAADAVAELIADLGMPSRLRDVGVTREQFDAIAQGSVHNVFVSQNPRKIESADQILEILEMAW